jgi:RNA 2',3'-cyclic 3'-phosphodiesterase
MRLFVALPVDEEVREGLRAATEPWRSGEHPEADGRWRWARPEGWHVTLAFLGEVEEDRAREVAEVVGPAVAGIGTVRLALDGVGHFGRRVLHVALADEPSDLVASMGERAQGALASADLPVKQQQVVPHLTLARARRGQRPALLDLPVPDLSWTVEDAEVYVSHLHPEGARYEVLDRLPLV